MCVCVCVCVCVYVYGCVCMWMCGCVCVFVCVLKMHAKRCTVKRVQKLEAELNKLESEAEHRQLTSQENMKRKKLQQDLWSVAQAHESLMRQKARSRWIKEGARYLDIFTW